MKNVMVLLTMALSCACSEAGANIVYSVDITDGTETLSGTITTDGTIGPLSAADFTAWDLTASGPASFVLTGPPTASCDVTGCGVTASLTNLEFTGSAGQSLHFLTLLPGSLEPM